MNPIKDAVAASQLGWTSGVMTAAFLVFFVAWTLWAWWPGNRAALEAAGRLPFDDGPDRAPSDRVPSERVPPSNTSSGDLARNGASR